MTARVAILSRRFAAAKSMEAVLTEAGFAVAVATREADAVALAESDACDLVILHGDRHSPGPIALCPTLKAYRPALSILGITPESEPAMRLQALDAGADEVAASGLPGPDLVLRTHALAALKGIRDEARRAAVLSSITGAEPEPARGRVLVLDAHERSRTRLAELLGVDFAVTEANDPARALVGAAEGRFDVAWLGDEIPACESSRLARQLRQVDPAGTLRVLLVADADASLRARALQEVGIDDLIRRPVDRCEALARTRVAVSRCLVERALRARAPWAPAPQATRYFRSFREFPGRFAA